MSKFFIGGLLALALMLGGCSVARAQETAGLPQNIQDLINQLAHNVIGGGGSVNTSVVGNAAGNTLQLGAGGNVNTYISHGVDGADKLLVDGDIIARENGTNGGGLVQGEKYLCVGKGNNNQCFGGEATDRPYELMPPGGWCGLGLGAGGSFACRGKIPNGLDPNSCPKGYTPMVVGAVTTVFGNFGPSFSTCIYLGSGN